MNSFHQKLDDLQDLLIKNELVGIALVIHPDGTDGQAIVHGSREHLREVLKYLESKIEEVNT